MLSKREKKSTLFHRISNWKLKYGWKNVPCKVWMQAINAHYFCPDWKMLTQNHWGVKAVLIKFFLLNELKKMISASCSNSRKRNSCVGYKESRFELSIARFRALLQQWHDLLMREGRLAEYDAFSVGHGAFLGMVLCTLLFCQDQPERPDQPERSGQPPERSGQPPERSGQPERLGQPERSDQPERLGRLKLFLLQNVLRTGWHQSPHAWNRAIAPATEQKILLVFFSTINGNSLLLSEQLCWNPRVIAKSKIEIPSSNSNKHLILNLSRWILFRHCWTYLNFKLRKVLIGLTDMVEHFCNRWDFSVFFSSLLDDDCTLDCSPDRRLVWALGLRASDPTPSFKCR